MKIKTITCHDVYNYGASLQAYALQYFLMSLGHDVEIIDYKPDYMRNHYKFWYVPKSSRFYEKANKSVLFKFLLCCYFAPMRFSTYGRKNKFDLFRKEFLHLTRRYNIYNELQNYPPDADVYIAGSDQIWNSSLSNGKDPSFFLQFGDKKVKRIAYAASFGIPEIEEKHKAMNRKWLETFDAIAVRESTGVGILKSLGIDGVEVLDPVYLLTKSEWEYLAGEKRIYNNRYLLIYDLCLNDDRLYIEAKKISEKYNLKIISVDGTAKCPYADKNISDAGPREFLNLIKNAEFVITNSFHATSFSIIFHIPFAVFYKYNNISRMHDLLVQLGLINCLNSKENKYTYDWAEIDLLLQSKIFHSKRFLMDNLK